MGKGLRLAGYLAKQFTTKPLFNRMKKETQIENKRYDRLLSKIEQNIEVDRIGIPPQYKEVDRMFDLVIRFNDKK